MDIPEPTGVYTHEYIMQWNTDGTDEWSATRKEKLIRCKNCIKYEPDGTNNCGYCDNKWVKADSFCSWAKEKNK